MEQVGISTLLSEDDCGSNKYHEKRDGLNVLSNFVPRNIYFISSVK